MKAIDLEEADIDSCVVRVTLDAQNAPLWVETIAACGCFHKVFVERWVEDAAGRTFRTPEAGKKFVVERSVKDAIDWEVAGVIDEPRDQPRRPVVFLKAGDHKVIGMGSAARLRVPPAADSRPYALTDYSDLYSVAVAGSSDRAPFFDLGGKVRGAQRKERFIFTLIGVDAAGQPRANDQIKLHFDQSTWSDPTIYDKYMALAPGNPLISRSTGVPPVHFIARTGKGVENVATSPTLRPVNHNAGASCHQPRRSKPSSNERHGPSHRPSVRSAAAIPIGPRLRMPVGQAGAGQRRAVAGKHADDEGPQRAV